MLRSCTSCYATQLHLGGGACVLVHASLLALCAAAAFTAQAPTPAHKGANVLLLLLSTGPVASHSIA